MSAGLSKADTPRPAAVCAASGQSVCAPSLTMFDPEEEAIACFCGD